MSQPKAPEMPKIGISQILPMVVLFASNKWDPAKLGYTKHVEFGYAAVQVLCLGVLLLLRSMINAMPDDGKKIHIKAVKQWGTEVKPACEQTAKEYDLGQWREALQKLLMTAGICGFIYYKWGSLTPLVLQLVMTPTQMAESGLFRIHIRGQEVKRPFPVVSPFGALMGNSSEETAEEGDSAPKPTGAETAKPSPDAGAEAKLAAAEKPTPLGEDGFCVGQTVEVSGLKGAAKHNGKTATVDWYNEAKGRYVVTLSSGESVALRPGNLSAVPTAAESEQGISDLD